MRRRPMFSVRSRKVARALRNSAETRARVMLISPAWFARRSIKSARTRINGRCTLTTASVAAVPCAGAAPVRWAGTSIMAVSMRMDFAI